MNTPPSVQRNLVLLVNPRYAPNRCSSSARHALTPSLALPTIAAATPDPWHVIFHDENLSPGEPPDVPIPEVVGITVHTAFAARAYELARRYRALGSKVVLGGLHVTALPEEAARHADVVVTGEGAGIWPDVLKALRRGALPCGSILRGSARHPHYAAQPWPRRDILPRGAFLTNASIIATRGCTQRCGYCYLSTRDLDAPYQKRKVSDVLAEIDAINEHYVVFTDNNLMADPAYGAELCRALRPRRLMWSAAVTVDVARHPGLVRLMAESGCHGVFIGLETLSDDTLRTQRKHTLAPSQYVQALQLLSAHGIDVNGSFVFGFDADGPDVFDRTLAFIVEQRLACATFHILTPYPGTPLFEQMDREGRILMRDWSLYDTAHAVFRPKRMTPSQLEEGYRRAYENLYAWDTIWARRPRDGWMHATGYLAATALYKKCDVLWQALVPCRLTHAVWHPIVQARRLARLARWRDAHRQHNPVLRMVA